MLLRIENKTCDGSVVLYRKINKFLPNFYCTKLRQKLFRFLEIFCKLLSHNCDFTSFKSKENVRSQFVSLSVCTFQCLCISIPTPLRPISRKKGEKKSARPIHNISVRRTLLLKGKNILLLVSLKAVSKLGKLNLFVFL